MKKKLIDEKDVVYMTFDAPNGMLLSYPVYMNKDLDKQIHKITSDLHLAELKMLFNLNDLDEAKKLHKLETKECPKCHQKTMRIEKVGTNDPNNPKSMVRCRCGYSRMIDINKYRRS